MFTLFESNRFAYRLMCVNELGVHKVGLVSESMERFLTESVNAKRKVRFAAMLWILSKNQWQPTAISYSA